MVSPIPCRFIRTLAQVRACDSLIVDDIHLSLEWLSGDRSDSVNWNAIATDAVIIHEITLVAPEPLAEKQAQAEDTTTYYGMQMGANVTYMADTDATCRSRFNSSGSLTNTVKAGPDIINK